MCITWLTNGTEYRIRPGVIHLEQKGYIWRPLRDLVACHLTIGLVSAEQCCVQAAQQASPIPLQQSKRPTMELLPIIQSTRRSDAAGIQSEVLSLLQFFLRSVASPCDQTTGLVSNSNTSPLGE